MIRSAIASTARPSAPVKKSQGPGLAGTGGLPALGVQGRRSTMTAARADKPPSRTTAVVASNSRRLNPIINGSARFREVSKLPIFHKFIAPSSAAPHPRIDVRILGILIHIRLIYLCKPVRCASEKRSRYTFNYGETFVEFYRDIAVFERMLLHSLSPASVCVVVPGLSESVDRTTAKCRQATSRLQFKIPKEPPTEAASH